MVLGGWLVGGYGKWGRSCAGLNGIVASTSQLSMHEKGSAAALVMKNNRNINIRKVICQHFPTESL